MGELKDGDLTQEYINIGENFAIGNVKLLLVVQGGKKGQGADFTQII